MANQINNTQISVGNVLDQDIVNLAKAIRNVETGNKDKKGASGESGRYQYMPGTWSELSKKYLGNEKAPLNLENQNKVAYYRIKELKDQGYNPGQIASIWNSGSPDFEGKVGKNAKGVEYNVPEYVNKVYSEYRRIKGLPITEDEQTQPKIEVQQPQKTTIANIPDKVGEVLTGIAKGGAETLTSSEKIVTGLFDKLFGTQTQETQLGKTASDFAKSERSGLENVGYYGEKAGELLTPTGLASKAKALVPAVEATAPLLTRLGTKALGLFAKTAGETAEIAGKTYLGTGSKEKAGEAALVSAIGVPVTSAVGSLVKFLTTRMPEGFMQRIFQTTGEDFTAKIRSLAKGKEVNPTLAKELLDRGLFGTAEDMAITSLNKLDELEKAVQTTVQAKKLTGQKIIIDNKTGIKNLLTSIRDQFKSGLYTDRAKEADRLIKALSGKSNQIDIDTALAMRRFIDRSRNMSSFKSISNPISAKQDEFKTAADQIRKKLSEAGLKDLMNEERIYINALSDITDFAVKQGKKNIIGPTDYILGGGGLAAGAPGAGLGVAAAARAFQQPASLTGLAQGLYRTGKVVNPVAPLLEKLTSRGAVIGTRKQ